MIINCLTQRTDHEQNKQWPASVLRLQIHDMRISLGCENSKMREEKLR